MWGTLFPEHLISLPFREFMIQPSHYIYIIWICQFWDYVYGLMTGLFAKIILIDVLDLFYYNMHEYVSIWVLDVAHFVYFQIRLAFCFRLSTPGHPLLNSPLIVLLAWNLSQVYAVKHYIDLYLLNPTKYQNVFSHSSSYQTKTQLGKRECDMYWRLSLHIGRW